MQPLEPEDPHAIGEYRLLRRLGAGGMGRVYLGRSASGRTVAVKVVHPHFCVDEEFRRRFGREVAAARRVGGEWTAPVLDADPDAKVPWVVTGYVAGPTLTRAVTEHGPLPEHSVRALGAGLAEALHHVHGLGLVHRDVKPSNVLLTVDGPRLIDFGIARATDGTASLTSSGVSVGSPGYMAPEQVLGKSVDGASDVFSLGAVLAYAARGEAPFTGDNSAALLYKVVYEPPELTGVEGELRELIAGALAKDAGERPAPLRIAERLAGSPGGAVALVGAGWLPAPVVEEAGRSAVAVLGLEAEREGAAEASGPVPFTALSHTPPPAYPAGDGGQRVPPQGEFGPPAPYGSGTFPLGARPEPAGKRGFQAVFRAGRGRSCAVALTLSAAFLALGGILLPQFLPNDGPPDSADQEPAVPPAAGQKSKIPAGFVGSWEGPVHTRNGMPGGTLEVTIKKGRKGDEAVTAATRFTIGDRKVACRGTGTVTAVSGKKLTVRDVPQGTSPTALGMKLCNEEPATDTYTLTGDGQLRFASQSEISGRPTAALTRAGG